jgi:predicted DNA-binding WGR domain protein
MASTDPNNAPREVLEPVLLRRIDPARNMARFYEISLEPSLFGDWAVARRWGRIGRRGRFRLDFCDSADDAYLCIERLVALKRRRGYQRDHNGPAKPFAWTKTAESVCQ